MVALHHRAMDPRPARMVALRLRATDPRPARMVALHHRATDPRPERMVARPATHRPGNYTLRTVRATPALPGSGHHHRCKEARWALVGLPARTGCRTRRRT